MESIDILRSQYPQIAALIEFAISADRDYTECDKMFIHIHRLKIATGYNAYQAEAKRSGVYPMTFEQWLYR